MLHLVTLKTKKHVLKSSSKGSSSSKRSPLSPQNKKITTPMKTEKVLTMMKSFRVQTAKTVSAMKAKVSMKKPSAQAKIVTKGSGGGKKRTKKQDLFTAELGLVVLGKKWFIGFKARRGDITRMKNELGRAACEHRDLVAHNRSYGVRAETWKSYRG